MCENGERGANGDKRNEVEEEKRRFRLERKGADRGGETGGVRATKIETYMAELAASSAD